MHLSLKQTYFGNKAIITFDLSFRIKHFSPFLLYLYHATGERVCLLVGCLTSQQQTSVPQGRICSDNCTCCHTEIEVADQTFYLTQSQYTDTGPTSPALTLERQVPSRVATGVPIFESLV